MKFLWLLVNPGGPDPGAAPSDALGEGHGAHGRGDRATAGTPFDGVMSQRGGLPGLVNIQKRWKDPPFLMGKSTISVAIFHSYVCLPEGTGDR